MMWSYMELFRRRSGSIETIQDYLEAHRILSPSTSLPPPPWILTGTAQQPNPRDASKNSQESQESFQDL